MANGNGSSGGGFIGAFPMIAIAIILYNVVAFAGPAFFLDANDMEGLDQAGQVQLVLNYAWSIPLISGDIWVLSLGDILLFVGLVMLFQEVVRATSSSSTSIFNHVLSLLLFVIAIVEFLVVPGFGTSVFFLLICMTLFDVMAGFTVSIVSARRDFGGGGVPIIGND